MDVLKGSQSYKPQREVICHSNFIEIEAKPLIQYICTYSRVPNSGTGTNNSTGWEKSKKLIIVQGGINVIGGIYPKIK